MKLENGKLSANFFEKIVVFGKQNMGKPEVLDGKTVLVRHSVIWRIALLLSVIAAISSQYIGTIPWYVSIGLLCIPFLMVAIFAYGSELYVKDKS